MWVTDSDDGKLYTYNLPQPRATGNSVSSEDSNSTLKDLKLSGIGLNPAFSPDKEIYTVLVDHDGASTTVTATPNDSGPL